MWSRFAFTYTSNYKDITVTIIHIPEMDASHLNLTRMFKPEKDSMWMVSDFYFSLNCDRVGRDSDDSYVSLPRINKLASFESGIKLKTQFCNP